LKDLEKHVPDSGDNIEQPKWPAVRRTFSFQLLDVRVIFLLLASFWLYIVIWADTDERCSVGVSSLESNHMLGAGQFEPEDDKIR
jgi:hypothetical protein